MNTLYGIKNCITVRKALSFLEQHQIPYQFHDYKKQGIDEAQLLRWLKEFGFDKVINKNGTTWRNLSEEEKNKVLQNETGTLEMAKHYPSIIKRPILVSPKKILIGFNEALYQELIP